MPNKNSPGEKGSVTAISDAIDPENLHVRPDLQRPSVKKFIRSRWMDGTRGERELSRFLVQASNIPIRVCTIEDFLSDNNVIGDLVYDLSNMFLEEKHNDLFKLQQSPDLSMLTHQKAKCLLQFLKGECRLWLQHVTGVELSERVDATFSVYTEGDYLLCHDDQLENRKIAFILYCNKICCEGGSLVFYDTDGDGNPKDIVRTERPVFNKFIFFEVSDKSFHRVEDVMDGKRLSVNGWFYAKEPAASQEIPSPPPDIIEYFSPHDLCTDEDLTFINKRYLDESIKIQVKTHFLDNSEILLHEFLNQWGSFGLQSDLDSATGWLRQGPLQSRCYDILPPSQLEVLPRLAEIIMFFKSKQMFDYLAQMTGVDGLAAAEKPRCSFQIQRWTGGCYSMINNRETIPAGMVLDLFVFIGKEAIRGDGGEVVYIDHSDGTQLLLVTPELNAAGLVYRDDQTHRFVRYITSNDNPENCYVLYFTYFETVCEETHCNSAYINHDNEYQLGDMLAPILETTCTTES